MNETADTPGTEIGFLCDHGHFCLYEDPTYDRSCAGHRVAGIFVVRDEDVAFREPRYEYDGDQNFVGGDVGYSEADYDSEIIAARESLATQLQRLEALA
jgi:hypothetical protein